MDRKQAVNTRRKLLWGVIALVIAGLVIRPVISQSEALSPGALLTTMLRTPPVWMLPILLSAAGFIVFEALSLRCILRGLGYPATLGHALLYSAGDQFFSAITPSASGGQPASALFMGVHGLPAGSITAALLLNLIEYTAATLFIGAGTLLVKPHIFRLFDSLPRVLVLLGMAVLIGLMLVFILLLRRGEFLERLGQKLIRLLVGLRLIKRPDRWTEKLDALAREYRLCADTARGKPVMLMEAFLFCLAQRVSQIAATPLVFLSQGGEPRVSDELMSVHALSLIGAGWVPIPGGMGAVDYLMIDGFQKLLQGDDVYRIQLLSRGISFYLCTLISGVIVLIGFIGLQRRKCRCTNAQMQ